MNNISKITMIAGILTIVSYCSGKSNIQVAVPGSEIKAPADATSVAARVLADSGATLSIGTSVQLTVPAGALPADTDISIEKKGIPPQQETLVPVAASLEFGAHGTEFNKPVALNVCYDAARLAAQGIKEETVAVYYVDPATGEYASIGGSVNKASHCVTADLQHFSTYLVAAQILQGGNNAPVISAPTLLPTTPMAGLPLRFSTVITDFEQNTVNGQVGFGQIATARLFYRIYQGDVNAAAYTEVGLTPDYNDATATRFTAKIPASAVTTAGLEYYIRAADNLGLVKLRYPVKVPNQPSIAITSTATGLSFQTNVVTDLAAGFKRSYTVKGNSNLGGSYNVEVESFAVNNGIGTATQLSSAVVQFTATTAGAQSSRTGSLTVNSGAFSLTSLDIRVHAGVLDHIALLSPTGVVLGNTITVNANSAYDFDVLGYDAFGNTSNVLPLFVLVPVSGAGTISPTGLYTAPATAQTATLVATLDGVQDSILINVVIPDQVLNLNMAGCQPVIGRPTMVAQGNLLAVTCLAGVSIFQKGTNGQWVLNQTLQELDGTGHYIVPAGLAISGDYLAVVRGSNDTVVFKKNISNLFVQTTALANPDASSSWYGFSVAMNSNQLFIGTGGIPGAVHVYEKDSGSENWILKQSLSGQASELGKSLAASDSYLVVSSTYGYGKAFVFERDVSGTWNFSQELPIGYSGGQYSSVALKDSRILVGRSTLADPRGNAIGGLVLVFERDPNTAYWNQVSTLLPSDVNTCTPEGSCLASAFAAKVAFVGDRPYASAPYRFRNGYNIFAYDTGRIYGFDTNLVGVVTETVQVNPSTLSPAGYSYDGFGTDFTSNDDQIFSLVPVSTGHNGVNSYLIIKPVP